MINTIIFDFGGVLLNLDYSKTEAALKQIFRYQLTDENQFPPALTELFLQVEKGLISTTCFLNGLRSFLAEEISDHVLIEAWNAMLGNFPQNRLDMLLRLSKDFHLCLLSNTNDLHIQAVYAHLEEDHSIIDFEKSYFDQVFYSHLLGMRKPDKDIYTHVLDSVESKPGEMLFIDDTELNLHVPESLGIKCIHHDRASDIAAVIDDYIGSYSL